MLFSTFRCITLCLVLLLSLFVLIVSPSIVCLDSGRLVDKGVPFESVAASKAYLSSVVFKGTLYRVVEERDGTIRAGYGVGRVLRTDDPQFTGQDEVEIVYYQKRRTGRECVLPVTEDTLKLGSEYVVFGQRDGQFGFVGTAFPEEFTKKTMRQVARVLCENCAKRTEIEGLRNVRLKNGQRLRLQCHLKGNPIPWVKWFKDGVEIEDDGRIKVRTKRRSSKLIIRHVRRRDRGVYECSAGNVVDERGVTAKSNVIVKAKKSKTTTKPKIEINTTASTLWPAEPCAVKDFCLNGGKCKYYRIVGEHVCECAEGYIGLRCHYKDVQVSVSGIKHFGSRGMIP